MAIYDAKCRGGEYCPLFMADTMLPSHGYYALVAFNHLYKLGTEVYTDCDTEDVYVASASNGEHNAIVISNISEQNLELNIEGVDLAKARYHVIDQQRLLSWSLAVKTLAKNEVVMIEF